MEFVLSAPFEAYLGPARLVDLDDAGIQAFVERQLKGVDPVEGVRRAFEFVRDEVSHSWDIQAHRVTRSASEALSFREGICYPKSHPVAALLRNIGIPTAICYQRLTLFDDERGGYSVHALNAVYLRGSWHRLDARGNKEGVDAQFSLGEERLAFRVRPEFDEVDYPTLHAAPHPAIIKTLENNNDAILMYTKNLPQAL
jgi:transglutaminase-like putative cysteine protease